MHNSLTSIKRKSKPESNEKVEIAKNRLKLLEARAKYLYSEKNRYDSQKK